MPPREHGPQLARAPRPVLVAQGADLVADGGRHLVGRHHWGMRAIRERRRPAVGEAGEPFVAGFLADAELATRRPHRQALLDDGVNEREALGHER